MPDLDIANHQASDAVKKRAAEAGIDLAALKRENPQQYAMLNAQRLVKVPLPIISNVGATILEDFPARQLFELPAPGNEAVLMAFPPLDRGELEQLDNTLAQLAAREDFAEHYAYYRVVTDQQGERRELGVALAPDAWQGETGVMVGPFASEEEAMRWGQDKVTSAAVMDAVLYGGNWFCDVFVAEDTSFEGR